MKYDLDVFWQVLWDSFLPGCLLSEAGRVQWWCRYWSDCLLGRYCKHQSDTQPLTTKKTTLNTNISLNLSMHGCQTLYLHLTSLLMHSCSLRACRKLQRPGSVMYGKSTCGLLWVCVIQKPPRHRGSPVIGRLEGWATCQGSMSNTV